MFLNKIKEVNMKKLTKPAKKTEKFASVVMFGKYEKCFCPVSAKCSC